MNIGVIFKESFDLVRRNIVIIVPPIGVSVFTTLLTLLFIGAGVFKLSGMDAGMNTVPGAGGMMVYGFFFGIISMILQGLSQGMTIAMADEAMREGRCSLQYGYRRAMERVGALFVASVIFSILVSVGMMLFFIPGLIVTYIFMFTFVIIMTENRDGIEALKGSFSTVRTNLSQTFILFAALAGVGVLLSIISMFFRAIPLFGQMIVAVIMGGFFAFVSTSVLKAYRVLKG